MPIAASNETPMAANAPIGVFDSGVGGLSVLRHIRQLLPHEHVMYFADSGFAPYGDKGEDVITARSLAIAAFFQQSHIKAVVVACNTATAAAIKALRTAYPALPLVGVEPGLKPAAALSKSRTIGVLATGGTIASAKFKLLREEIAGASGARFLPQACIGLADQIEKGELYSPKTAMLVQRYVAPLLEQGADTLVLGCTHYPFVRPLIEDTVRRLTTRAINIIDTGEPVARQLAHLLNRHDLMRNDEGHGGLDAFTTGSETALGTAFATLLKWHPPITAIQAQAER
jgi:glutamate racemase